MKSPATIIKEMRALCDALEHQLNASVAASVDDETVPRVWGLTEQERKLAEFLIKNDGFRHSSEIFAKVWGGKRESNSLRVVISHIRSKIAPFGWFIENRKGELYRIVPPKAESAAPGVAE